jgi:hypothetical protein
MDRTLLAVTPGSFQAGGNAPEINHDPCAAPAVHAAPIHRAAKLILRRRNRRQKNHRIAGRPQDLQALPVRVTDPGMRHRPRERRHWWVITFGDPRADPGLCL